MLGPSSTNAKCLNPAESVLGGMSSWKPDLWD